MSNVIKDTLTKLNIMSYLNIMSFSVLSSCGTSTSLSNHDLDTIEELCKYMPPNQRPYNISITDSLYKQGIPLYSKDIDNPYNFEGYQWLDKKQKKSIDIEVQACSIASCCSIIEKLVTYDIDVENPQFIAFLLFKTAFSQAKFIKKHLKIGDIYYSGEDISENAVKKSNIQVASDEPDIMSQLSVMMAFTALRHISDFNIPHMAVNVSEFEEDMALLPNIYKSITDNISDIKSRKLVNIGLYIANIYVNSNSPNKNTYIVLNNIGSELLKRIKENGAIMRTAKDIEDSSLRTLFNSLNLISQLYYIFGSKAYEKACLSIYDNLNTAWDNDHNTFKLNSKSKQTYSIKDTSSIISALLSFYYIVENSKLKNMIGNQIIGFYDTAFAKSPIFTGQNRPILQQSIMNLDSTINAENNSVPVFNKAFEYKISKNKYSCESDIFKADYILPSCCLLLNNISNYCM